MQSEPTGAPTLDRSAQVRSWEYIGMAPRRACTLVFGFSLCTRIIPLSVDFGAPRQSARLQESEGGSTACAPPIVALLNQEPWTHYPVCLSCTEGCFASALPYPQRYALGRRRLVSRRRTDAGPDGRCPPRADNARRGRCEARPVRSCWMDAACRGWSSLHPPPLDLWACILMGVGSLPVYRAWPQHNPKTPTTTSSLCYSPRLDSHVHSRSKAAATLQPISPRARPTVPGARRHRPRQPELEPRRIPRCLGT